MLPARLSEADLEALLSPPAHAVLSHLPANPLRALADRLAAGCYVMLCYVVCKQVLSEDATQLAS